MTVENIEKQLMKLDTNSRAKLANKLLLSLEELSEHEIEKLWLEEALRRDEELSKRSVKSKPAKIIFKESRAKLRND